MDKILVNNKEYKVMSLLGKGKGGYSYLVMIDNQYFVIKQIHHEPCSYYTFGNKLESELNDYQRLSNINIRLPKLYEVDYENERILKEYIEGPTIDCLVKENKMKESYFEQVRSMAKTCFINNLNIDYYPTNFVVKDDILYYIDYECNAYDPKWDFENWGIQYWINK